jgi:hypothetical protein
MKFKKYSTLLQRELDCEVEFKELARCNATYTHAKFILKIDSEEFPFCTHDLRRNPIGICFYSLDALNFFKVSKKYSSVTFTIPEEVYDWILKTEEEKLQEFESEVFSEKEVELWFYQRINTYDTPLPLDEWYLSFVDFTSEFIYDYVNKKGISNKILFSRLKGKGVLQSVERKRIDCDVVDYLYKGTGKFLKDVINEIINEIEEEKRKKEEERRRKEEVRKKAIEEEVEIFGDDEIYASKALLAIHSIRIFYSVKENYIRVYGKTYDAKEEFKQNNFKWNSDRKCWETQFSEENMEKAIQIVRKYDKKIDPVEAGYVRCWECGRWFKPRKGDWDGFGWYCGC